MFLTAAVSLALVISNAGLSLADNPSVTPTDAAVTTNDTATALATSGDVLAASDTVGTSSDADSAAISTVAGTTVDVPKDVADGVAVYSAGSLPMSIFPPTTGEVGAGQQVAPGLVAYPSDNGSATAVQATEDGRVRMLTVVANADAPQDYSYQVSVPGGESISTLSDGSAVVKGNGDSVLATVDAPWARDANGTAVATYYTASGSTLTQHIDTTAPGIVFPVTADPWWNLAWKIAKCGAVLGVNLIIAYRLIKVLRAGLSIYQFATLLVRGTFAREKLLAIAGTITGISSILDACMP